MVTSIPSGVTWLTCVERTPLESGSTLCGNLALNIWKRGLYHYMEVQVGRLCKTKCESGFSNHVELLYIF